MKELLEERKQMWTGYDPENEEDEWGTEITDDDLAQMEIKISVQPQEPEKEPEQEQIKNRKRKPRNLEDEINEDPGTKRA